MAIFPLKAIGLRATGHLLAHQESVLEMVFPLEQGRPRWKKSLEGTVRSADSEVALYIILRGSRF